jgi:hypothetical protein
MGPASELESHFLLARLARDLKLIDPKGYTELAQRAVEVKRTHSIQKLIADR